MVGLEIFCFIVEILTVTYYNEYGDDDMHIESEVKFLKLFGLEVVPRNEGYAVVDVNHNQVGAITPLGDRHYQVEVETDVLKYKAAKAKEKDIFDYDFFVKRDNEVFRASLSLGEKSGIQIRSEEWGNISFLIDGSNMHLDFDEFGVESKINEKVDVEIKPYGRNGEFEKRYCYHVTAGKKKKLGSVGLELLYSYVPGAVEEGHLKQREAKFRNGEMATVITHIVEGNLKDVILEHKIGIDAMVRFRYLMSRLLPFDREVLSILVEDIPSFRDELLLFLTSEEELREVPTLTSEGELTEDTSVQSMNK